MIDFLIVIFFITSKELILKYLFALPVLPVLILCLIVNLLAVPVL